MKLCYSAAASSAPRSVFALVRLSPSLSWAEGSLSTAAPATRRRGQPEPVEGPDKGRGYEYPKNAYIPVDKGELDAIAIESTHHTIEIDSFVPREQIDERYLDGPYYITKSARKLLR